MNEGDVLGQLVGAPPRRLLEDLARTGAAHAKNDRSRPEVEVYLVSGQLVRGRIVSVVDPIGRTVSYTYNAQGTLETVTNAARGVTRYDYDSQNRDG